MARDASGLEWLPMAAAGHTYHEMRTHTHHENRSIKRGGGAPCYPHFGGPPARRRLLPSSVLRYPCRTQLSALHAFGFAREGSGVVLRDDVQGICCIETRRVANCVLHAQKARPKSMTAEIAGPCVGLESSVCIVECF